MPEMQAASIAAVAQRSRNGFALDVPPYDEPLQRAGSRSVAAR